MLRRKEVFRVTVDLRFPDTRTRAKLLGNFSEQLNVCGKSTVEKRLNQGSDNQDPVTEEQVKEKKVKFEVDFNEIAQHTPGYSWNDLITLSKVAIFEVLERCHCYMQNDLSESGSS